MPDAIRLDSARGRWIVAGSVVGSGAVFLESTVVNVALPAIAREFGLGIEGLQWVVNGYLVTLSALMLLGGGLGDRFRRSRVFAIGCLGFAGASLGCALAPNLEVLVALRMVQGIAGALLVPNSLAILETSFRPEDRSAAIGQWAAGSAVSTALGPLLGGLLVDVASWRWVFAGVIGFALVAAWIARRHLPEEKARATQPVDYPGAILVTLGLAGVITALIVLPDPSVEKGVVLVAGAGGVVLLAAFVLLERRTRHPLLPLAVFRSRQFSGANVTTLLAYAALGGLFFLLMPLLQSNLGYSALAAGASLLPINVVSLLVSPISGRVAGRIGPRWPMTAGTLVMALGMVLFTRVGPGARYVASVFRAAAVFGLGLATMVAPLTSAVLGAVAERDAGVASAVNNAAARLAGLLGAAALPLAAGIGGMTELQGSRYTAGFIRAMWICAGLCVVAGVVSLLTVRQGGTVTSAERP